VSVRRAIVDWSDSRPPWQQDLLRRVAVRDADDQACLEVLDLLLGHRGLAPAAPAPKPLSIRDLPDDDPESPSVLYEIGECRDVNAISSQEPLRFESPGVTLVYGPNGVGKAATPASSSASPIRLIQSRSCPTCSVRRRVHREQLSSLRMRTVAVNTSFRWPTMVLRFWTRRSSTTRGVLGRTCEARRQSRSRRLLFASSRYVGRIERG
jgi:hypothetical protein